APCRQHAAAFAATRWREARALKPTLFYGRGCRKHQMICPFAFVDELTISQPLIPAAFAL
ncbi:MAG TPA: hypothetical protein VNW92_13475, partial [Polyangiaceae bacterium]|nr:hypothetical protein [Polyangiaceae bacterium]